MNGIQHKLSETPVFREVQCCKIIGVKKLKRLSFSSSHVIQDMIETANRFRVIRVAHICITANVNYRLAHFRSAITCNHVEPNYFLLISTMSVA